MISFKQVFRMAMATMLIFALLMNVVPASSFAKSEVKDGEYTIGAQVLNAKTGEKSMADDAITKPLKLKVEGGKLTLFLTMADSMYELGVDDGSGSYVLAKEFSEDVKAATFTYTFPVKSLSEPLMLETTVAAMGRKVNMKLVLDQKSLSVVKVTQAAAPVKTPVLTSIVFEKADYAVSTAAGKNTVQLKMIAKFDNGKTQAISSGITYAVSDQKLAAVSTKGIVTLKSAAKGKTVSVTASYQGKKATVKITGK